MSSAGSSSAPSSDGVIRSRVTEALQISGYHFTNAAHIPTTDHYDNVTLVNGYRVSDKRAVVAKVSSNSLQIEREYYIIRQLYQTADGPLYLVRPLEYAYLSTSGLAVAIYADAHSNRSSNRTIDDIGTFLRLAIRCTDIMEFVHRHSTIHGQLNMEAFCWNSNDMDTTRLWNFSAGSSASFEKYLTSEGWKKYQKSQAIMENRLMYISPEQTGRTTYIADHRSDIYSLGVIFFVLLTGRMPFDGGPLKIVNSILSRKMPAVHEIQLNVPEAISRIIEKMTCKTPEERYMSMHGAKCDLEACLQRLKSSDTGTIDLFPLAQRDIASVFMIPRNVYGRQAIISEMVYIIERFVNQYRPFKIRSNKQGATSSNSDPDSSEQKSATSPTSLAEHDGSDISSVSSRLVSVNGKQAATVVGIYGPGGIGKSTLFNSVQPLARKSGYITSTKFDSRNKIPYSGLLRLMSQALQQILSETEEEVYRFFNHMKEWLGVQFSSIPVLADLVPELKSLLAAVGQKNECTNTEMAMKADNAEARLRFHNLFVEVFRAISHWRMVTIFIDDVHQADDPSIDLLQALLLSRINILVFMSYRDQEMNEKQSGILENEFANIQFIEVGTLKLDALTDFVCDTLHRSRDTDRDYVTPLASVIHRKTNGNAFFTAQLLRMLERKKIIYFNWEFNVWEYDHASIEQGTFLKTMEEDVSFMVNRLKELPRHGQRLLKMASFVGDTFSWSTVKALMEETFSDDGSDDDDDSDDGDKRSFLSVESMTATSVFSKKSKSTEGTLSPDTRAHHQKSYDPISGLHAVIQEGYVMPLGADEFKWSHDRITQAASELVKPNMRGKIHFMIAQHMMKEEEDMDVFLVADHLLKCLDLLSTLEDKSSFRGILIDAGDKGRQSGAHDMALSYYKAAIQLSDSDTEWDDDNYPVTLQLYTNTMGLSFLLGDNEVTEKATEVISKHAKTPLDRKAMYFIKSRYYLSQQKPFKGRDVLLACLEDLGNEKLSFEDAEKTLQEELDQLENAIADKDVDEIANVGLSDDPYVQATAEIMGELSQLMYWTGQKQALSACACHVLNMCLKRGMAPAASTACGYLAAVGYIELYKNYAAANKMAKLGTIIADRYGGNLERAQAYIIYVLFVDHFERHQRYGLPMLGAATQRAFASGDRHFTNYGKLHYSMNRFAVTHHLSDALPIAEESYEEVHKWSAAAETNAMLLTVVRAIKALQGRTYWDTDNVYDGDDGFNDEHFLTESFKQNPHSVVPCNWYQSYKMIPLALYERYEAAVEIGEYCFRTMDYVPCVRYTRVALFYYSIALIGHARENKGDTVDKCRKQVAQNQDRLYEWVELSRVNYITFWTLVEAEMADLQGDNVMKAILLYEEAINHAREGEWYLELCIAHELAGGFYYRQGVHNVAYNMIKKAVDLYTAYGAFGKSRHLNAKYADLLSSFNDDRTDTRDKSAQTDPFPLLGAPRYQPAQESWSSSSHDHVDNSPVASEPYNSESIPPITTEQTLVTLDIIDMASILKSSHVLSSEVKFEALLKNMMQIILENSGADRGAIIVKESKFGIGAYGSQQEGETIVTYEEPERISKNSVMVSSQIINHTIHTSESIFIPDVEQDARFAVGPWFERVGKKSVICMPIIHKTTTVGCIFLEGAIGIFTHRHITVLGLLCQQMGISLTNASLFKSVRRVTMANMKMIEMQKQALEEARRSKEAADKATRLREIFLANMSHEIRTPFSGFYGMITLLSETKLDPAQYDLVRTAKSSCEGLLQIIDDLLNFSKLQAGKVSLDLAPVHVEELIADVIDMLIAIAIQKRINVTYTVAEDVPAVVMADANRLRQIIINLLGNAVKFTHHGEISIRCSIDGRKKKAVEKGSHVPLLFEVIDTGIGISEEQRKVLFMPFSQVDGSTTRKYGGTGLGLSICLQLVTLMNGDIDVVSETGKGSNFRFSIQVSPVHDQSRRFTEAMQAISKSFIKTRVLVADTHHATVDMMTNFLPNLPLDGVSDYAELQQETPYGVVIVGLLLDHKEGTLSKWENELQKIMKRAKVTVIMHYPLGTSNVQGNIGGVGPILEAASSSMEQEQQRQRQQQPFHISSYGHLDEQQNIVRMGVPLRRNKLLKMLAGFLKEDVPGTPAPKSRPNIFARISSSEIKLAIETIPEEHRKAFKKTNILVAEDNPVAQKLLCKQLKRYGFNITCANNGAEAIAAWTKRPAGYFKMALFDHHMPKCDGVEATKTIRRNEKEQNSKNRLPIVALTADIQDSARAICVNAGMDGYLTKPLNEFALLEFVKQYCIDQ